MTRLENRLPREGISSDGEHPLREAAWLVGASVAGVLALVVALGWAAGWLAPRLPFSAEVALAERMVDRPVEPAQAARTAALQARADRVAAAMALPAEMRVVIGVHDADPVNAYATIGGRIRLYRGLIEKLPSEEALDALLAHEIAHVEHRHVAASAGRGLAIVLVLSALSADAGAAIASGALGQAAELALLGYSREQETLADAEALRAVVALHGHAGGILALMQALGSATPDAATPAWLRTHPLTAARRQALAEEAQRHGWALDGPQRPLADPVRWPRDR